MSSDGSACIACRTTEDMGYGAFCRYATEPYNMGLDRDLEHLFGRAVKEIDRECKDLNQPYLVLRDALDYLADRFTVQPETSAEQNGKTMAPAIGIGAAALAVLAAAVLLLGRKKRKK